MMNAVVEADGSVKDVEVVESLDTEYGLDDQATTALKQWEFKPGLWMGEPVPGAHHGRNGVHAALTLTTDELPSAEWSSTAETFHD